ncbi:MAG: hypothetical protein HOY79_01015 [Streptomyces sp.]|nr:hypothetical protein [Streptomyces sp.]
MSITALIPGRRDQAKHRGKSGLELKRELAEAARKIAALTAGMEQITAERNDLAKRLDAAQIDLAEAREERDEWRNEALAMWDRFGARIAAEANANRVDVPPMYRDTSDPADQATTPIDVKPLWEAFKVATVTVVDNPDAVDPARSTTT